MKNRLVLIFAIGLFGFISKAQITSSIVPTRISGTAPLSVFFDATGTTHTDGTIEIFKDLNYHWSFGDVNAGVFELNDKDKNKAKIVIKRTRV